MKVVKPEWLVESAQAGELLPWQDFIFHPNERPEDHQGKMTTQKNLSSFATRKSHSSISAKDQNDDSQIIREKSPPPQAGPSHAKPSTTPLPAARVPRYAAHESNPIAQRAMANPDWRSAHTSAAPDFIEGYYKNSRLHHLSTWKAELKELVAEAQERAESGLTSGPSHSLSINTASTALFEEQPDRSHTAPGTGTANVSMKGTELLIKSPKSKSKNHAQADQERIIMHCDFDCFFVSAGLVGRPDLRGKPVVVCHSQGSQGGGSSTSEIASSSYEARKYGIKNGMRYVGCFELSCPILSDAYH
jgi:DNA repair protein REV1